MATYMVDSEGISTAATRVASSCAQIRTEVNSLMAELTALQNTWTGSAAAQFADCATQWQSVHTQVETTLENIGQQLTAAAHVYADAESQSAALFSH